MEENYPGDEIFDRIETLCEQGEAHLENGQTRTALQKFKKAFKLLPAPQKSYPTGTWLLTMMGDIHFSMEKYSAAFQRFRDALEFPEGSSNPFVQLRLGQAALETNELALAKEHLQLAVDAEGLKIFEDENPKYLQFLESKTN